MRHKFRAAGKKNKEGKVERGGNLPLLGSTHAVFNFFSHLFVLSTETERLEQAYTAQLTWVTDDYLTNRFHVAVLAAPVQ